MDKIKTFTDILKMKSKSKIPFILLIIVLSIISCKKEIEVSKDTFNSVTGKWQVLFTEIEGVKIEQNSEIELTKKGRYISSMTKSNFKIVNKPSVILNKNTDQLKLKPSTKENIFYTIQFIGIDTMIWIHECEGCAKSTYLKRI